MGLWPSYPTMVTLILKAEALRTMMLKQATTDYGLSICALGSPLMHFCTSAPCVNSCHWYGRHTALFAIHHPTTSASFFLISHASGHRVQFAFTSPADVFREPHLVTGNMQTERTLHLDSSMQRPSSRTAATRGCNSSGNGWLRQSVAAARDGCVIGILLGLQQRVAATQAFST